MYMCSFVITEAKPWYSSIKSMCDFAKLWWTSKTLKIFSSLSPSITIMTFSPIASNPDLRGLWWIEPGEIWWGGNQVGDIQLLDYPLFWPISSNRTKLCSRRWGGVDPHGSIEIKVSIAYSASLKNIRAEHSRRGIAQDGVNKIRPSAGDGAKIIWGDGGGRQIGDDPRETARHAWDVNIERREIVRVDEVGDVVHGRVIGHHDVDRARPAGDHDVVAPRREVGEDLAVDRLQREGIGRDQVGADPKRVLVGVWHLEDAAVARGAGERAHRKQHRRSQRDAGPNHQNQQRAQAGF